MTGRNSRALLNEVLIAVLFFALCCCVLMGIFKAVHEKSEADINMSEALVIMKNLAEQLHDAHNETEFLSGMGFVLEDGFFQKEIRNLTVRVSVSHEENEFGRLGIRRISAYSGSTLLGTLCADRYFPKEAGA